MLHLFVEGWKQKSGSSLSHMLCPVCPRVQVEPCPGFLWTRPLSVHLKTLTKTSVVSQVPLVKEHFNLHDFFFYLVK